jgi:hypothetical protein
MRKAFLSCLRSKILIKTEIGPFDVIVILDRSEASDARSFG